MVASSMEGSTTINRNRARRLFVFTPPTTIILAVIWISMSYERIADRALA
jgi:hypothetical protein